MAYITSSESLSDLLATLKRPVRSQIAHMTSHMRRIASNGWACRAEIEDLLLECDQRLSVYGFCDVGALATMLRLQWVDVADKPHRRTSQVILMPSLSAYDIAHLMINLERMGLNVDPEPLVAALLPTVEKMKTVSSSQLSVLWFKSQRHRSEPIVIKINDDPPVSQDPAFKTSTGYRVLPWRNRDGELISLRVIAPKFRRKPNPVRTVCPDCGFEYFKGDFDSGVGHHREHKARMRYLDPQPHTKLLEEAQFSEEATLVTSQSPAWKHEEMYIRAAAFKREFHYDFVQWGSRTRDSDPNVHGFLFSNEHGSIIGACAFRYRQDNQDGRWALQWIWICPKFRRQGHLGHRWAEFRRRFGDFLVESPISEAMQAFLSSQGDSHLAR